MSPVCQFVDPVERRLLWSYLWNVSDKHEIVVSGVSMRWTRCEKVSRKTNVYSHVLDKSTLVAMRTSHHLCPLVGLLPLYCL